MSNRFFKLPIQVDVPRLQEDLYTCEKAQWVDHFNKNDYQGDWTGIALRSATGHSTDLVVLSVQKGFVDTPLLEQCPYFQQVIGSFLCEKDTIRLLALSPGSEIKTHRDNGLGYEFGIFRIHIPITTDEKVAFVVDGEQLNMEAGACWYANFDLPHSVRHLGTQRRIHLVIDCQRNEWSDALFARCGYDFEIEKQKTKYDLKTVQQMLLHLRANGSDTAHKMADDLIAEYGIGIPPSGV
jgi:hypothetical protein